MCSPRYQGEADLAPTLSGHEGQVLGTLHGVSPTKRALGNLSSLRDLTPFRGSLSGHFLLFGELLWAELG